MCVGLNLSNQYKVNGTFDRNYFTADPVLLTSSMYLRGYFGFGGDEISSFNVGFFVDIFKGGPENVA